MAAEPGAVDPAAAAGELLARPVWQRRARCRGAGTEAFFSGDTAAAVAVCAGCAVRGDCLAFALTYPVVGVWGGLTETELVELRGDIDEDLVPASAFATPGSDECGGRRAYRQHLRRGEQPCRRCLAAEAARIKAIRTRRRAG